MKSYSSIMLTVHYDDIKKGFGGAMHGEVFFLIINDGYG